MPIISGYLKDPTIKLSPPALLNDPFESKNAIEISDFIYSMYREEYQGAYSNGKKMTETRAKTIITRAPMRTINSSGIVSLSESNRSLLMWAHYANQHQGLVLGIEDDFLEEGTDVSVPARLINTTYPVKVNYDTIRFDPSEFDNKKRHISIATRKLAMKMLTTKSDDWLYEKEHRIIMPLALSDKIKFIGNERTFDFRLRKAARENKFSIDYKTESVLITDNTPMTDHLYQYMSSNKSFLFLKRINPKKIKSIYFGVRADSTEIEGYMDDIYKNPDTLGHIKLYKYRLCNKSFSLLKSEINEDDYDLL
ncbi:DUF2971 domain-containing protein [Aeromonas rivipollensis]|uniref:DUF2971 domain-containing protein n=1 Tax=Aeromonas rivipollensis TaxID=948519 RepID=UPI003D19E8AC